MAVHFRRFSGVKELSSLDCVVAAQSRVVPSGSFTKCGVGGSVVESGDVFVVRSSEVNYGSHHWRS